MRQPFVDFIAYGPEGNIVLLAEAKARLGTSETWAAKLRRNMLSHGTLPKSSYLLIATPDRIYGWGQEDLPSSEVPPQFLLDSKKVLEPYFSRLHQEPAEISPSAFELLILSWLQNMTLPTPDESTMDPSLKPLAEAGVLASLKGSHVEVNSGR